ncbi:SagB/ThcOx family dehydrogenase [Streptomyces sp. PLAI1-29]|uniref:SagB/ThcOx family dehydrogenase n=1 Tax=Streptomyces zingiberis TaxID=2053010 RepID=A0ABX1BZT8_9ACTN|nr:SagB/ThcOx family dehydrogenase [Streptomyces zingiberis]
MDLAAALARARSPERPGPDAPAGGAVRSWPGPPHPIPEAGPGSLDLHTLLRLSLAASDGSGRLRPTPSAGALHPVDSELAVGEGCSLPPGRYGYDPLRHQVHHLGGPPHGTPPGLTAGLSVTARRTASHYGHRAWPLLLLDTGHAAAALVLAARAPGSGEPRVRLDGRTEHPLVTVHIPAPGPARIPPPGGHIRPSAGHVPPPAGPGPVRRTAGTPGPQAPDGVHVPRTPEDARVRQVPEDARVPQVPGGPPTAAELLARRSSPPPLPGTPPRDALHAVLTTAARAGGGELRWCAAVGPPEPGLVEPAGDGTALRRYAAGDARPALAAWAAGQAWLADAGAVLLAHGCPADAGAPHIRRAHLRAGFAVHLAHIAARRHGLAARPVGSWQQADLGAALGAAPGRDWVVHALALGTHHADEEKPP